MTCRRMSSYSRKVYSNPRKRCRLLIKETVKRIEKNRMGTPNNFGKIESKLRIKTANEIAIIKTQRGRNDLLRIFTTSSYNRMQLK